MPCWCWTYSTDIDPDWTPNDDLDAHIRLSYESLIKNRDKLVEIYRSEFFTDLTRKATNKPDRYASVNHNKLEIWDVVLLVDQHVKSVKFPMGVVRKVVKNSLGEVTHSMVMKDNRKVANRHVKHWIFYLRMKFLKRRTLINFLKYSPIITLMKISDQRSVTVTARNILNGDGIHIHLYRIQKYHVMSGIEIDAYALVTYRRASIRFKFVAMNFT